MVSLTLESKELKMIMNKKIQVCTLCCTHVLLNVMFINSEQKSSQSGLGKLKFIKIYLETLEEFVGIIYFFLVATV